MATLLDMEEVIMIQMNMSQKNTPILNIHAKNVDMNGKLTITIIE